MDLSPTQQRIAADALERAQSGGISRALIPLSKCPCRKTERYCPEHGPALRRGKPWFDKPRPPLPDPELLPSPAQRFGQVLRMIDAEYQRCRNLLDDPGDCRKLDPWTLALKRALDVEFPVER